MKSYGGTSSYVVETTVDPVSGMITTVTEVPPCTDDICKGKRLRVAELLSSPLEPCHGQCEWLDGCWDEGWGCY